MGNAADTALKAQQLAAQTVTVGDFAIDAAAATNEQFRAFVRETKYMSDSERFGWSFVLEYQATERAKELSESQVKGATHWLAVPGSYWRVPDGPGSGVADKLDHPATHLSYNDAKAYCAWRGLRLATETEWEYAARGGLAEKRYPWGDALPNTNGQWRMNVWQGKFPLENTLDDGFGTTCPSRMFEPNAFGLFNMLGNVWEWTASKFVDPHQPIKQQQQQEQATQRVLRGGSFLDSVDGAFNHFVDLNTRMGNTEDSASSNTGVRCATSRGKPAKGAGYRYPKPPKPKGIAGLDQEMLQKIVEEGGVEALQEFLGNKATVTTPGELKKRQEELHQQMEAAERARERAKTPGQAPTQQHARSEPGLVSGGEEDEGAERIEL